MMQTFWTLFPEVLFNLPPFFFFSSTLCTEIDLYDLTSGVSGRWCKNATHLTCPLYDVITSCKTCTRKYASNSRY